MAVRMLPHAYPFQLLDRILAVDPGVSAVALKNVGRDDAHSTSAGIWPAVLVAECLAQTAGLAAAPAHGDRPAVLARIDRFRCGAVVQAGDQLLIAAQVVRRFGATVKVRGVVRVGRRRLAAAEVVLQFLPDAHDGSVPADESRPG